MERGRARRLLVSLGIALGAAAPALSAPRTIAEQRLALYAAPAPDAPAGETARRAWAIAELEERAGNSDLAAAALTEALRRTAIAAATGALTGDPGKADAIARFDETVKRVVAFAKRSGDGHLLLEALRWRPELADEELGAIQGALLSGAHQVPTNLRGRLRARLGTTPEWRAFLDDAWPPEHAEMDAGLESLGDLGCRLLHQRLSEALRRGDLTAARQLADRIWRADRWDVEARVLRHLIEDVQAGATLTAAEVASVADPAPAESRIVIRLDRARAARPEALGLSLAIAFRLQRVHLFADVPRETARVLASPRATAEQRLTAQALDVLAKLEVGPTYEPEAIRWQKASGAERSLAWAREVLTRPRPADDRVTTAALGALDRAVLTRVFADPFGPTTADLQRAWARRAAQAIDSPALRNAALAVLAHEDREAARLLKTCIDAAVAPDECGKRLELLDALGPDDEDDWGGAVNPAEALSRLSDLPASRLESIAGGDPKALAELGPALARLRNDRYEGTPGLVRLELAVAVARRDWAAVRATFARGGALLPIDVRTSIRLLLAETGGRAKVARESAGGKAEPLRLPAVPRLARAQLPSKRDAATSASEDDDPSDDDEAKADGSLDAGVSKLVTAIWMRSTHPKRALEALRPAWQRLDGAEGGELAGWMWTVARDARDPALERRALTRMLRIAPVGEATARVSAERALERGDGAEARRWAKQLWQTAADAGPAASLFARAFVAGARSGDLPAESAAWIARLGAGFPFSVWGRLAKALDERLARTAADLAAVVASENDAEKSLALSPDLAQGFTTNNWIGGQLASLSPEAVVPFATRVTAYLSRRRDKTPLPALAFWAPFVAGDRTVAAEAAQLAAARSEDRRPRLDGPYVAQLTAPDAAKLLAGLQAPLPVPLRQQVYKWFERREASKTDLPALLESAAETSKDKADAVNLRQLACLSAERLQRVRQALALCGRAWGSGARTPAVAAALGKLLASDPDAARAEKIDAAAFFREATPALTGDRSANVRHEQAIWLSKLGRHSEAASLEADAWASGYGLDGSAASNALEWTPYQPLLVRTLMATSRIGGAQRALAIGVAAMASGDVDLATPYLLQAVAEYEHETTSAEQQQWASFLVDTAEVLAADLAKKRIDRGGIGDAFMAAVHQTEVGALPGLTRRYPRSLYLALLAADAGMSRFQAPSAALMTELQREFPRNVLVLHGAIRGLVLQKRHAEAAALAKKAMADRPGDKRVEALAATVGSAAGPKASLPTWAASGTAFDQALASAEPGGALVEKARLESDEDGAFDVYVPGASAKIAASTFTISHQGVTLTVTRVPRVTFCNGPACLEELVPTLAQQGVEEQWSRAVKLPLGDGQEGLFRGPAGLALVDAVPVGPYVFYVSAGGPPDKLAAALPAVRLVRETIRYRNAALGPARTALLHRHVYFPWTAEGVAPRVRLKLAAAAGDACPIAAELRELAPSARATSVTSLYLLSGRAEDRLRLLRCLSGSRDASAALALATIWDTDPDANAFGRAALPRVAAGVVRALGAGVDLTGEETSYDPDEVGGELFSGVIQVMTMLPSEQRRNLGAQLMASGEPRLRALALASLHWVPGGVSPEEVEAILRAGSDGEAAIVTAALPDPVDGPARAAMRARLAAIPLKPTARQRRLATLLALALAPLLEAADSASLARIRPALAAAADTGARPAKHAVTAIDAHALALTGSTGSTEARTLLASWRAKPLEKSTSARAALERPLSDRLPEHGWSYFRVGEPGVFLAGLADLANAAGTADDGRTSTARSLLRRIVSTLSPEELRRSGVDLDRPFECAMSTSDGQAWACTAALADPAAARRHPLGRGGHRSGVTLPWLAGATALTVPTSNLFLPMLLPHEPPPPAASDEPAPETGWLVTEQVTDATRAAGVELRRAAAMYVGRDHSIDADEMLTFVGRQRVWLFSDLDSSRVWLTLPAHPKGGSPTDKITGTGIGAAALVAWAPAGEDDDTPDGLILEADGLSAGVRIRVRTSIARAPADTRGLAELLPPGAALSFVGANVAGAPIWRFRPLGLLSPSESTPPLWLWQAAEVVAFGWYAPDRSAKTGEGWVSILPWSPEVEKAWRAHDLPAPGIKPGSVGSLSFVRRGPALVVGSRPALLAVRSAPLAEASAIRAPALPVSARADGGKLADLLDRRAAGTQAGSGTAAWLKSVAAIVGLISSAETRASVQDGVLTSETWIHPTFAARGRGGASIDELLRNQRLKNSLRLPHPLSGEAAEHGVTLTFSGASAEGMRRAFPDSDRLTLAQLGPDRFKVTVLPRPKNRKPAPLSELDRRLYVSPGGTAPPGAVRAAAADIAGKATSTWDRMRAVVDWVKREMKYEITPRQLDDVTLLELRRGDCTEYAQLTVALLRGLGIPARMRTGLAGEGSLLVAHAWVEFHDGEGWHEVDPTAGRIAVDASYIDVSVMDLLPLIVEGGIRVTDLN